VRKRIYLNLQGRNGSSIHAKASKIAVDGYEKIADYEYNINPDKIFKRDAGDHLDFSMRAHNQAGYGEGIQISDIGSNPLAQALGLKEGDVLLEVNGKSAGSLLNSARALVNACRSDDLQLKIRRGEKIIMLKYHLLWKIPGPEERGDGAPLNSIAPGWPDAHPPQEIRIWPT
jgi:hypothetical protein